MDKTTAIRFKDSGHPVWFLGVWSDLPTKARIMEIKAENGIEYAHVNCIYDEECCAIGPQDIQFERLYPSKEGLLTAMAEKERQYVAEIKAVIQTMEDCIRYLYDHHVARGTEYTDWSARKAIQELARERWGLELE